MTPKEDNEADKRLWGENARQTHDFLEQLTELLKVVLQIDKAKLSGVKIKKRDTV